MTADCISLITARSLCQLCATPFLITRFLSLQLHTLLLKTPTLCHVSNIYYVCLVSEAPASPALSARSNYDDDVIPLGALPGDIDENGLVNPNIISYPAHIINIMRTGFHSYIPLNHLTNDSIANFQNQPFSQHSVATMSDRGGRLIYKPVALSASVEKTINRAQYLEASHHFVQCIQLFCSSPRRAQIAASFQNHFEKVIRHCEFNTRFEILLDYCCRVRHLWEQRRLLPDVWQSHIFDAARQDFVINLAQAPSTAASAGSSNATTPLHQSSIYNSRSSGAEQRFVNTGTFRAKRENDFCIVCGRTGHPSKSCSSARPFLRRSPSGRWLPPTDKEICFRWNNQPSACPGCSRQHICTVCGGPNHAARHCPTASA